MTYTNESSYRRAAVEGSSSVALVIMLYDRLVADLQRGAAAIRNADVETRCAELKHALLILQQLEGSLDQERGGAAARNLGSLYSYARSQVMEAQLSADPQKLEKLAAHFRDVRTAWQQADAAQNGAAPAGAGASSSQPNPSPTGRTLSLCV